MMIHPGMALINGCWLDAPRRRLTNGLGRRLLDEPLRNVICLERRRVPRTFWGSNEPRAEALTYSQVALPSLIQMGVWCASATDVQPRERKTGCAWTDNRECSDASTRRRFRTPLDKGPVNGWTDNRECSDASTRRRFRTPLDKGPVNGCPLSRRLRAVDKRRLLARTQPHGMNGRP